MARLLTATLGLSGTCSQMARQISDVVQTLSRYGDTSRKQFVKDHSERVDVACRCNRLTAYLLWARVLRIHDRLINRGRYSLDTGFFRIVKSSLQIDPLGDAKINELGHAIRGNQDVGWLQISVNHRAIMRKVNGLAKPES